MSIRWFMSLGVFAVAGCQAGEVPLEEPAASAAQPATTPDTPTPLAVLTNGNSRVEWFAPDLAGDEVEVAIGVTGPTAALLHPDFVERVGAVTAYLAATTTPLPAALRPYATRDDLALEADPTARAKLRAQNEAIRSDVTRANLAASTPIASSPAGCTASQATWAANHYGAAYSAGGGSSGSKTCGQNLPFNSVQGTTYYCNIPDSNCDYGLAHDPVCDADSCTAIAGYTTALRERYVTPPGSGATFQHYAERYRFGYYNCSTTDDAVMRRRRNGGSWVNTTVHPLWLQIRVGGNPNPATNAFARDFLAYAGWKEDYDWSVNTALSKFTQFNMVTQNHGFMCGDLIQGFLTEEISPGGCNDGRSLCEATPCTDGCW